RFKDGMFARDIKAERTKEVKEGKDKEVKEVKDPPKKETGKEPAKDKTGKEDKKEVGKGGQPKDKEVKKEDNRPDRTLTGVITFVHKDYLLLSADQKEHKIYRSGDSRLKVTVNGSAAFFSSLQAGDKATITFDIGKYFNDPLTDSEQDHYKRPGVY